MSVEKWIMYMRNPKTLFRALGAKGYLNFIPDSIYLSILYKLSTGKTLNLNNPKGFNEKLQWLKLNDRKPNYTKMVDKYEVRSIISEKIGEEYLFPLLGVWDSPEAISWEKLPNKFVLKCTHGSGTNIICQDKSKLNITEASEQLNKWLRVNWYWFGREWPYKNVKPRIIAEKFMIDDECGELRDYKIYTFMGKARIAFIATERSSGNMKADYFDKDFNHLNIRWGHPNADVCPQKPYNYERMFEIAEILAAGTRELRVDFFEVNKRLYVGELTFFDGSGLEFIEPPEWEGKLGSWIDLS